MFRLSERHRRGERMRRMKKPEIRPAEQRWSAGATKTARQVNAPPLITELDDHEPARRRNGDDHGADDALGLYLRQMGAIPLLNREKELALARKLERARLRFRHAALTSGTILNLVLELFTKVREGRIPLDPSIDVVTSLKLSRDQIARRLPAHVPTLRRVLKRLRSEFTALVRTESAVGRRRQRQRVWRHIRKARQLAKELSPRTELLERWAVDLLRDADGLRAVAKSPTRRSR